MSKSIVVHAFAFYQIRIGEDELLSLHKLWQHGFVYSQCHTVLA
jgi:hypothetical protein